MTSKRNRPNLTPAPDKVYDVRHAAYPPLPAEAEDGRTPIYSTRAAGVVGRCGGVVTALIVPEGGSDAGALVIVDSAGRALCQLNVFNHGPDGSGLDRSGRSRVTVDVIAEEADRGHVRIMTFAGGRRREVRPFAKTGMGTIAIRQGTGRPARKLPRKPAEAS